MRRWTAFLLAIFALLAAGTAAAQERRIALVIANESYVSPNLGRLPGTQGDAAVMSQALKAAGFQVKTVSNLGRLQMQDALLDFARDLKAAPNSVGFLYYSGHGMADSPRGRNYLIPVDANIQATTDLPVVALSLDEQLQAIELAGAAATIVVIDACRNMPVSFRRDGRGFAPMNAATDTLIAFSTQPGEIASDDGLYARTLAEELVRSGADTASVFQAVQSKVASATSRRQRPRYDNGLLAPIVFKAVAAPVQPVAPPLTPSTQEKVSDLIAQGFANTAVTAPRFDGVYWLKGPSTVYYIRFLSDGRACWQLRRHVEAAPVVEPLQLAYDRNSNNRGKWSVKDGKLRIDFDAWDDHMSGPIASREKFQLTEQTSDMYWVSLGAYEFLPVVFVK